MSEFWDLLRTAHIIETNEISSALRVSQDGVTVEAREFAGDLHIDDKNPPKLQVYVPMDQAAQGFCFGSPLPVVLAKWLMGDLLAITDIGDEVDSSLVAALTALLQVDISAVDRTLDCHGIFQVSAPHKNPELVVEGDDSTMLDLEHESLSHEHRPLMPEARHSAPATPLHRDTFSEDTQYLMLLNRIKAAAGVASFPSKGPFDMDDQRGYTPPPTRYPYCQSKFRYILCYHASTSCTCDTRFLPLDTSLIGGKLQEAAVGTILNNPNGAFLVLPDPAHAFTHRDTLCLLGRVSCNGNTDNGLRAETGDDGITLPAREQVTLVDDHAARRDNRNPESLWRCKLGAGAVLGNCPTIVVATLGNQRPPIVGTRLNEVKLVATHGTHFHLPKSALGVPVDTERVPVAERPDLGLDGALARKRVASKGGAVVVQLDHLTEVAGHGLRWRHLVDLARRNPQRAIGAEKQATGELESARGPLRVAPNHLEAG